MVQSTHIHIWQTTCQVPSFPESIRIGHPYPNTDGSANIRRICLIKWNRKATLIQNSSIITEWKTDSSHSVHVHIPTMDISLKKTPHIMNGNKAASTVPPHTTFDGQATARAGVDRHIFYLTIWQHFYLPHGQYERKESVSWTVE